MGGLIQQPPLTEERESAWLPILLGIGAVVLVVGIMTFFLHSGPRKTAAPDPYAANLKLSDVNMSAAANFVGATVTYMDGRVSNTGDKTVSHALIHVTFRNSMGEVAQVEDVPLRILQTNGPYPDAVDLSGSPLTPGQSKPFRLTFEHVSTDWNQAYPEVQVTEVAAQ
jgi:hypothetical protein